MATISDIKSWDITDENIIGNVGDTNITLVTTDFHEVEVLEVQAPAPIAIIDVGVVGLGNTGGGEGGAVESVNGQTGVVVLTQDNVADGTTAKQFTAIEKTKLAGVATGATANDTDTNLKNRANHTGTQEISTVSGLQTALDGKASSTALSSHTGNTSNPHGVTKSQVGLGNVDNTADSAKPISTAQQTALDGKQPLDSDLTAIAALAPTNNDVLQRKSGAWTNRTPSQLKTDLSLTKSDVGLSNVDNTSDTNKPVSTATQTALDGKANASHTHTTSNITGLDTLLSLGFYFADGTTSTNARPSVPGKVIWVGGTTQPVNMATGDIWIKA